jgi:hypothetical protein
MEGARYLEDGRLTIFKRSGGYCARIRLSASGKCIWRSLKTTNEQGAVDLGRSGPIRAARLLQWYCRYCWAELPDEDARRIKRWKTMRRHVRQIQMNCQPGDILCRKRQRLALLHWAYDSRGL